MLDCCLLVWAQRAPSFSAHGAFCQRLVVAKEAGASRSLNRLASTWHNAPALQLSTTHCPQRPCRVLQALNSTQQLGIDEPLSWHLERPWTGRSTAPGGTRSERWTPSSGFLPSESPSVDGGAREHPSELTIYPSHERRRAIYMVR
jgi:hypothetical protein